jgi:hypothetical protein
MVIVLYVTTGEKSCKKYILETFPERCSLPNTGSSIRHDTFTIDEKHRTATYLRKCVTIYVE